VPDERFASEEAVWLGRELTDEGPARQAVEAFVVAAGDGRIDDAKSYLNDDFPLREVVALGDPHSTFVDILTLILDDEKWGFWNSIPEMVGEDQLLTWVERPERTHASEIVRAGTPMRALRFQLRRKGHHWSIVRIIPFGLPY
jgi:hypothetical protein